MEIYKQKLLLIKEESFEYNQKINNTMDVVNFISKTMKINNEAQEVAYILMLNTKNQINGLIEIARRRYELV